MKKKYGEIEILGIPFECRIYGAVADRDDLGTSNFDLQVLTFAEGLRESSLDRSIMHEIIEITKKGLRLKITHDDIERMDMAICQTLKANGVDLSPLRKKVTGK